MSPETLRQNAEAMIAYADGKPVEYRNIGAIEWNKPHHVTWNCKVYEYRPKPEPKTRGWNRPEDVPGPVCWIRTAGTNGCALITGIAIEGIYHSDMRCIPWCDAQFTEYSTDRNVWKSCTMEE